MSVNLFIHSRKLGSDNKLPVTIRRIYMNLTEKKEQIERELAAVKDQIENCNHEYGEIQYDPEKVKEPYGSKIVTQGSDVWFVPEGFRYRKKERWSQTCTKCGHKRYTTKTQPTGYKPVF